MVLRVSLGFALAMSLVSCSKLVTTARPSQAEIQACVDRPDTDSYLRNSGRIQNVEYGTTSESQGGMMDRGAPKGTTKFPIKYRATYNPTSEAAPFSIWMFKDSFGEWKCVRAE